MHLRTQEAGRIGLVLESLPGRLLCTLIAALVVRGPSLVRPEVISADESIFALAARAVLHGALPYERLFDIKPVGSTLLLAGAFNVLGDSLFTLRLVGLLCAWVAALLLGAVCEAGGLGRRPALLVSLLYIAASASMDGLATMTEIMMAPFAVLSVLLLVRARQAEGRAPGFVLAAGLACGMAVAIKLVPIVPGLCVAGAVLLPSLRARRIGLGAAMVAGLLFLGGALLPLGIAALAYARIGLLPLFLHANFGFGAAYAAQPPALYELERSVIVIGDALWPLLVALLALAGLAIGQRARLARKAPLLPVALAWLLGEGIGAASSMHFYPHYFLALLPPLCWLAGMACDAAADRVALPTHRGVVATALLLVLILIPFERAAVRSADYPNALNDPARRVAQTIASASGGRPITLFVADEGQVALYRLLRAPLPATRFAIPAHLFTAQSAMIGADPQVEVRRVLATHPAFLVVTADRSAYPAWAKALFGGLEAQGYARIATQSGVDIYRRDR